MTYGMLTSDELETHFARIKSLFDNEGTFLSEQGQQLYDSAAILGHFCLDLASCLYHGLPVDRAHWPTLRAELMAKFDEEVSKSRG